MFGKSLSEYVAFQKPILILVAGAVGFPIIGWLLGSLVLLATRKPTGPASA